MERGARRYESGPADRAWFSLFGLLAAIGPTVGVTIAGILSQRPSVLEMITRALVVLGFLGPLNTLPFVLYVATVRTQAVSIAAGVLLFAVAAGMWIAWYPLREEDWTAGVLVAVPLALLVTALLSLVADRLVLRAKGSPKGYGATA